MNADDLNELIPIAGNLIIVAFLLIGPLLLARRWFPRSTRMLESIAWPVIIGIAAVVILAAILPYLFMIIFSVLALAVTIGVIMALYRHRSGGRQHKRPRSQKKPGRVQPVRRPAGRQRRN